MSSLFFLSLFFSFLLRMVVLWICCGLKPAREAGGVESMGSVAVFSRLPRHALSLYGGRVLKRRGKGAGRVNRSAGNGAATRSAVSGSLPPFSTHYIAVKRYPRQALCNSVLACAPFSESRVATGPGFGRHSGLSGAKGRGSSVSFPGSVDGQLSVLVYTLLILLLRWEE